MVVKTISVTYGRKINLGDYNSANVECTLWADVDADEETLLHNLMSNLWTMAKERHCCLLERHQRATVTVLLPYAHSMPPTRRSLPR